MALVPSNMPPLGMPAPDFDLPDPSGRRYTLADFADARCLVVVFLCNHCPYVKHLGEALGRFSFAAKALGAAMVGINPNDWTRYPEDSPEKMAEYAKAWGFRFPYLIDETQAVSRAYRAACTPDFFVFDAERKLAYRGQFDDSRPGGEVPVSGEHMMAAITAVLAGEAVPEPHKPSTGCSIKWRE